MLKRVVIVQLRQFAARFPYPVSLVCPVGIQWCRGYLAFPCQPNCLPAGGARTDWKDWAEPRTSGELKVSNHRNACDLARRISHLWPTKRRRFINAAYLRRSQSQWIHQVVPQYAATARPERGKPLLDQLRLAWLAYARVVYSGAMEIRACERGEQFLVPYTVLKKREPAPPDGPLSLNDGAVSFLLEFEAVLDARSFFGAGLLTGPVGQLVEQDDGDQMHMAARGGAEVLAGLVAAYVGHGNVNRIGAQRVAAGRCADLIAALVRYERLHVDEGTAVPEQAAPDDGIAGAGVVLNRFDDFLLRNHGGQGVADVMGKVRVAADLIGIHAHGSPPRGLERGVELGEVIPRKPQRETWFEILRFASVRACLPSDEGPRGIAQWAEQTRSLDAFDGREPGRCAVLTVESGVNAVRLDGGEMPSTAGVERSFQLFLTDGVGASGGTIVTKAQDIQGSTLLGHRG